VDGFVRTLDAIRLECWTGSDQNAGRHHLRTPGRLPLESARHIEPSSRGILQQCIEPRPLLASLETGHAVLGVDLRDLPAALLTHGLKRQTLIIHRLAVSADP
jgi:hypothetical protein